MVNVNGVELKDMTYNSISVQSWVHNGVEVFSSGVEITYVVRGVKYVEKVKKGASILSPTTFTPTLSGATFRGWSSSPYSAAILTNAVATSAITLYAIFTYNTLRYSIYSGSDVGFGKGRYNFYADYSKYYQMYVTNSNPGGMHGVRVYPSNNEFDLLINLSGKSGSGEGISYGYINSWTTGELQLLAYSNYAYSFTTGTVELRGRTIVG